METFRIFGILKEINKRKGYESVEKYSQAFSFWVNLLPIFCSISFLWRTLGTISPGAFFQKMYTVIWNKAAGYFKTFEGVFFDIAYEVRIICIRTTHKTFRHYITRMRYGNVKQVFCWNSAYQKAFKKVSFWSFSSVSCTRIEVLFPNTYK